jgi:hypothetical protein
LLKGGEKMNTLVLKNNKKKIMLALVGMLLIVATNAFAASSTAWLSNGGSAYGGNVNAPGSKTFSLYAYNSGDSTSRTAYMKAAVKKSIMLFPDPTVESYSVSEGRTLSASPRVSELGEYYPYAAATGSTATWDNLTSGYVTLSN